MKGRRAALHVWVVDSARLAWCYRVLSLEVGSRLFVSGTSRSRPTAGLITRAGSAPISGVASVATGGGSPMAAAETTWTHELRVNKRQALKLRLQLSAVRGLAG